MTVSIIIPTLNEEGCLADTLALLRSLRPHQVIVVDGGSTDATCKVAAAADALLHAPRGRAVQMNLGAAHATGDVLLFLHADCALENGSLAEAVCWLRKPEVVAGCFRMRVRAPGFWYRALDLCASARVQLTGLAYGDQGLFLLRNRFRDLGGFPPLPFMEDLYFSRELRRHGRVIVARRHIFVSPRRWKQTGIVRQTLRNWTLTALAGVGMPPQRLARFYPVVR